jgi:hypothetical protein
MGVQLWILLFCGLSIGMGDIRDFKDRTITYLANGAIPYRHQVPSAPSFPSTV